MIDFPNHHLASAPFDPKKLGPNLERSIMPSGQKNNYTSLDNPRVGEELELTAEEAAEVINEIIQNKPRRSHVTPQVFLII